MSISPVQTRARSSTISEIPFTADLAALRSMAKLNETPKKKQNIIIRKAQSSRKKRKTFDSPSTPRELKKQCSEKENLTVKRPPLQRGTSNLERKGVEFGRNVNKKFKKLRKRVMKSRRVSSTSLELVSQSKRKEGRYWGVSFETIVESEVKRKVQTGQDMPVLFKTLIDHLYEHGLVRGIFREAGSKEVTTRIRHYYETTGEVSHVDSKTDVHSVGDLLKTLIGRIPGSLLTQSLFEQFANVMDISDDNERIEALKIVTKKLTQSRLTTLRAVMRLLFWLQHHREQTLMTAENLATCIAPNFVNPVGGPVYDAIMLDQSKFSKLLETFRALVRFIIENYIQIFEDEEMAEKIKNVDNVVEKKEEGVALEDSNDESVELDSKEKEKEEKEDANDEETDDDDDEDDLFASPQERLQKLLRTNKNNTENAAAKFVYYDDADDVKDESDWDSKPLLSSGDASNRAGACLARLLEKRQLTPTVEWRSSIHGALTRDEFDALVLPLVQSALINKIGADEPIQTFEGASLATIGAALCDNHGDDDDDNDNAARISMAPLFVHNNRLFVGFNEKIWKMKIF